MSNSFRPVIERWGYATPQFTDHDTFMQILYWLDRISDAGMKDSDFPFYDTTVVCFENGAALLKLLSDKEALLARRRKDNLCLVGLPYDDLTTILKGLCEQSDTWETFIDKSLGGSLTLYVD